MDHDYNPPPMPPDDQGQYGGDQRPMALKVFAILSMVFGAMGVFCTPISIPNTIHSLNQMNAGDTLRHWAIGSSIWGVFMSIVLIAVGIGLWQRREIARKAAIGYSVLTIAGALLSGLVTVYLGMTQLPTTGELAGPMRIGFFAGAVGGALFGSIFPVLLLFFMMRRDVREACT